MTKEYFTRRCDTCHEIYNTASETSTTCGSCKHTADAANARARKTYYKSLEARDTVTEHLKTIRVQSKVTGNWRRYIYCPDCELLCNDDAFCRYCGKRLRSASDLGENDD